MHYKNTATDYGTVTRFIHWLIFFLVLLQILGGFYGEEFADPTLKKQIIFWHKSIGLTILWLMVLRILWAFINPKPGYESSMPAWERYSARALHYILYIMLILLPLNGWIGSTVAGKAPIYFNLITIPFPGVPHDKALATWLFSMHTLLAWILIGFIVLHVLAALKHHFIDRDRILLRMLGK